MPVLSAQIATSRPLFYCWMPDSKRIIVNEGGTGTLVITVGDTDANGCVRGAARLGETAIPARSSSAGRAAHHGWSAPAAQPSVTRQRIITSPEHWEVAAVVPTVFPPHTRDTTHDRVMTYWPVDEQPTLVVMELSTQRVVKKLVPINTASTDYALSPDGCASCTGLLVAQLH